MNCSYFLCSDNLTIKSLYFSGYGYGSLSDPDDEPSYGPGGSTLADIYCAYCRRYGLWDCIRRWCYSFRIAGFPTMSNAELLVAAKNLGLTRLIIK